jgi:hypothetical protein
MTYICCRNRMKKRVILLSIILFPSLIYLFFEMTKANFKKMAYFGPKTVNEKGDTNYYTLPSHAFRECKIKAEYVFPSEASVPPEISFFDLHCDSLVIDTLNYPVYCILFLDKKFHDKGYKLNGLMDYVKYKSEKLKNIPLFFISSKQTGDTIFNFKENRAEQKLNGEFDSIPVKLSSFIPASLISNNRDSFLIATYFKQKPYYVFDYFIALVDKQRHIRGYYDPTFNAEITRMIADYKHLKIRDGYAQTQRQNDIKQK